MPPAVDMLRWLFDHRSNRYRDLATGRYVSAKQVRVWANDALKASTNRIENLANMLASDRLTVTDWERQMRAELKREYTAQYLAGRGGIYRMTPAENGSIGGMLADQYRYLSNFARQIAGGNLTEGQILARAKMYINSAREAYERALGRAAKDANQGMVHWHMSDLNPAGRPPEHCEDCVGLEGMGWQPIGKNGGFVMPSGEETWPGSGATSCVTSCLCWIEHLTESAVQRRKDLDSGDATI